MKKVVFVIIFILILATSLVKNSTKEIEDKIFMVNENIRPLKSELGDVLLEYNYLSSPDKLTQYQTQYFEKDLIKIDITKIKKLTEKNNHIKVSDFIRKLMMNDKKNNVILEEYENEFSYKKSKTNLNIEFNRIAFIFFVFLVISIIYSIQLLHLGSLKIQNEIKPLITKKNYRADIIDRNGNYLVKTVSSIDIGINPIEVIDKKKLLINLQLIFPNKNYIEIKKNLEK